MSDIVLFYSSLPSEIFKSKSPLDIGFCFNYLGQSSANPLPGRRMDFRVSDENLPFLRVLWPWRHLFPWTFAQRKAFFR